MPAWPQPVWWEALPHALAGATFSRNEPLASWTTIKVGGPAEVWATFDDWASLQRFIAFKHRHEMLQKVAITWVGAGSNLMVRDGGIGGISVHLGSGFDAVVVDAAARTVYAEAGVSCGKAARAAREAELAGLAFFGGIPGQIGGALRMNAGAYGGETFDALQAVHVIDAQGIEKVLTPQELTPRYRGTSLPEGWVYKAGVWRLSAGNKEEIRQQMREINQKRSTTQPLHMPSSGSWFKNVMVQGVKRHAWQVTEEAGCRGMRVGGAQVSEMHANFFVNTGGATAADFEALSAQVERQVFDRMGIVMEREVRLVGVPARAEVSHDDV